MSENTEKNTENQRLSLEKKLSCSEFDSLQYKENLQPNKPIIAVKPSSKPKDYLITLQTDHEMMPFLASFDSEECIDFTQSSSNKKKKVKDLKTEDTIQIGDLATLDTYNSPKALYTNPFQISECENANSVLTDSCEKLETLKKPTKLQPLMIKEKMGVYEKQKVENTVSSKNRQDQLQSVNRVIMKKHTERLNL